MNDSILVERDAGIAMVTFNRPQVRNAITLAMWKEIAEIANRLGDDDNVRAILFRGAGVDAFASGADISEFKQNRKDKTSATAYNRQVEDATAAIRNCPKPTLAMIFGFCIGGGLAIAMACDLRFASEGSRFGIPAAKLGIVYEFDAVRQLVSLVGPAYAKDILFSGRTLPAEEAFRIGLIQRLSPVSKLENLAMDYLGAVTANAPLSIRGTKAQIAALFEADSDHGKIQEAHLMTFDSEDYKEGTRAFLEKRPPRFTGH